MKNLSKELKLFESTIAGSGGGGGCFRKGAKVQLEGGKTIEIEKLSAGDEVLAFDEYGEIHKATVTKLHIHTDPQPILKVRFWRGEIHITPNHWVLNQYGSFVEIGKLTEHDALTDGMGHLRPIIGAKLVGHEEVYNLTVEPHHTFIVDGIRVHNGGHRETFPVIAGSGGGKGAGGGGGMVQEPDTLLSKAMVSILDLIGEGQIGGLINGPQSIFFDGVPVQNVDGTWNFSVPNLVDPSTGQLLPVTLNYAFRDGQQHQAPIAGFSDVETPYVVSVQVTHGMAPAVVEIVNPNVNAVRLNVAIPSLTTQNPVNGSLYGASVSFEFNVSVNGGAYQTLSGPQTITGKTSARYQMSYQYNLPTVDANGNVATSWAVAMQRLTPDSTSVLLNDQTWFDSYVEIVYANLIYPNSAIIGFTLDSSQFSKVPTRTYLVDGLYVQIPSNYTPATWNGTTWVGATYTGVWDGTFKTAVCNNPAWVLYDLITNTRYGLGSFISPSQVDKAKLYTIAQYCDGLVPDGYGGMEPRFVINTVIHTRTDAYRLLADISAIFNGMTYWTNGMAGFMQDSPGTPVMNYTPANVIDGVFTYTGASRRNRHSSVLVKWNDPNQYYKQIVEYVEDQTLLAQYGVRTADMAALGCTSRGQAHRAGRWLLYTERYQSNLITFDVGLDSALVVPGDLINIHDPIRAGKRLGGRLVTVTTTSATLDAPVILSDGAVATISIQLEDGTFATNDLLQANTTTPITTVTWTTPLTTMPVPNAIWIIAETNLVPMEARVVGVAQGKNPGTFSIAAVESNPSKYGYIEDNLALVDQPLSVLNVIPVAPTGLTVTDAPYEQGGSYLVKMVISWDRTQSGVAYWKVNIKETDTNGNYVSYKTDTPTLDIPNVTKGQTFDVRVYSINALGTASGSCAEATYTVGMAAATLVSAPSNIAIQPISSSLTGVDVVLSWVGPTGFVPAAYTVQYRTNNGTTQGAWVVLPNTTLTSVTINNLSNGIAYDFSVASVSSIGVIGTYTTANETVNYSNIIAPFPPTGLTATGGMFEIVLNWTFSTAIQSLDYTEIWASTTDNLANAMPISTMKYPISSFTHLGLQPAQTWYYWIRVFDTFNNASPYFPSSATGGISAVTSSDPSALLTQLNNAVGVAQLDQQLLTPLQVAVATPQDIAAQALAATTGTTDIIAALDSYNLHNSVATIKSTVNTNTTATTANTTAITTLTSTVNTNNSTQTANLATESTTRANADSALATQITDLTATVSNNLTTVNASISSEATTRANADSANATSISNVSASLTTTNNNLAATNSNVASVSQQASANASAISGLSAKWVLQVDAYGHLAGMELASGANGTSAVVIADTFSLANSAGTPLLTVGTVNGVSAMGFNGSAIFDGSITASGAAIANAAIGTLKLAGNAVTIPIYANNTSTYSGNAAFQTIITSSLAAPAISNVDVVILFSCVTGYTSGIKETEWRIIKNGVVLEDTGAIIGAYVPVLTMQAFDTVVAGSTTTYTVEWFGQDSTVSVADMSMTLVGAMR